MQSPSLNPTTDQKRLKQKQKQKTVQVAWRKGIEKAPEKKDN
jgi:hypothetical protein